MASEIRVNKINNRAGLGTVTYTDTGIVVSGISTATNFKTGSSNLHSTGLNVGNSFIHTTGIEIAGVNVNGADTTIGLGATIYNSGAAVFTGVVTATQFKGDGSQLSGLASREFYGFKAVNENLVLIHTNNEQIIYHYLTLNLLRIR